MHLKIKLLRGTPAPAYATPGSAAMDLTAALDEPLTLAPGHIAPIPTGLAISLPSADFVALVFARSGLGVKHGVALANGVGVIDSDYRGEITVGLLNSGKSDYTINPGERIAQLAVVPVARAQITLCDNLDETARGSGGFGSTGR